MKGFIRQRGLFISISKVPTLDNQTILRSQGAAHPKGKHGSYVVYGMYGDVFVLGNCKICQRSFVIINWPHLVLLFHGKRVVRVDPTGSSSLSMGPLMKPVSASFIVAAKRLKSVPLSPELCTDSKRTPRLRLETFLRSSQVMLAGRN